MRIIVLARAALAAIVVFQGCASSLPKELPLLLSQSGDGVAVHAELSAFASKVPPAEITWVTIRVENLGKRYVRVPSGDIRLELPDGQRLPPMTPEMAREKFDEQLERWKQAPPPGYGSEIFADEVPAETVSPQGAESAARPSGTKVESPPSRASSEHPILRGFILATCLPAYVGMVGFLPALVLLPPCLALGGVGYAVGDPMVRQMVHTPKRPSRTSEAAMRRFRLGDNFRALSDVELWKGETATATLSFPVATVLVRGSPGTALTVPFVDLDGKEIVVRLLLTTPQ
jgi:hypothetical protein